MIFFLCSFRRNGSSEFGHLLRFEFGLVVFECLSSEQKGTRD